jgi:hypothetical protein
MTSKPLLSTELTIPTRTPNLQYISQSMVILTSKEKMKLIFNLFYITAFTYSIFFFNSCVSSSFNDEFHFFFRCKNNHTLRNILYKDVNGICPKFNEYDRAKKLQLILPSSQIS